MLYSMSRPNRDLRVFADEPFGLALVVREDAVVAGIDGRVVEPRTDFGSLAVAQEVHHVAAAPEIALKQAAGSTSGRRDPAVRSCARACAIARDSRPGPGMRSMQRYSIAAARQLHREHAADGAATDDQDGNFGVSP